MKKNILLVEDNEKYRKLLVNKLNMIDSEITIFETAHIEMAYNYSMQYRIDLFILDIILDTSIRGDTSGMDFADNIRNMGRYKSTPIIFITSLEDPKLFSYSKLHCYQYIEKPFDLEKTMDIIKEALEFGVHAEKEKYVYFRKEGLLFPAKVSEIVYITFDKPEMLVHFKKDSLAVPYVSMRKMIDKLRTGDFGQCNRNTIVNVEYIEYFDLAGGCLKIKDSDIKLQVGNVYRKNFLSGRKDD
ncbi:MAG: DNA-binding response regulator [Lachnospiraceae bacterium]|nr:DNA-binding response regulator [Lachnospiraceae bacterium]